MKTKNILVISGTIFLLAFLCYSFNMSKPVMQGTSDFKVTQAFPEEILKILTNSCFDCHSSDSQSKAASFILDFKKWDEYKDTKKVQLLGKINETVSEKIMPPKKYLNDNPSKALSDEQIKLVSKWAKEESAKLDK